MASSAETAGHESEVGRSGIEILGRGTGSGEQCLVCRRAIHGEPVLRVRYHGRVFHLQARMLADFEADPERYFRPLESRTALFDEHALEAPIGGVAGGRGWLAFGLWVLAGLVVGALCGALAVARGHRPLPWFFAGLALNALALAALLTRARGEERGPEGVPAGLVKVPRTRAPRACVHCGRTNHPAARACSACGGRLRPKVDPETGCLEGRG